MAKKQDVTPPDTSQQGQISAHVPIEIVLNVISFMDTMCARGAVRGDEMFAVGFTRQRLDDAVRPLIQQPAV